MRRGIIKMILKKKNWSGRKRGGTNREGAEKPKGKLAAKKAVITKWDAAGIGADKSKIGLSGSPTIVSKSFNPPPRKGGEKIDGATAQEKAKKLVAKLKELKLI